MLNVKETDFLAMKIGFSSKTGKPDTQPINLFNGAKILNET